MKALPARLRRLPAGRSATVFRPAPPPDTSPDAMASGGAVAVGCYPGLGDMLVALPVAYALTEAGRTATIHIVEPQADHRLTRPTLADLPALPLVCHDFGAKKVTDVCRGWHLDGSPLVDDALASVGIHRGSTPPYAALLEPPDAAARVQELVGNRPYVLVAISGHHRSKDKTLTPEQIHRIVTVCARRGLQAVLVHSEQVEASLEGLLNLSDQTTITDLIALAAKATAVVAPDCGVLHLAGAYDRPLLGILGTTVAPRRLPPYVPHVYLRGRTAADVSPDNIERGLRRILDAAMLMPVWAVIPAWPCGVVATAQRVAEPVGGRVCDMDEVPKEALAIAEAHDAHLVRWQKWLARPGATLVSVHAGGPEIATGWPAAVRGVGLQKAWATMGISVEMVPLPAWWPPIEPRAIPQGQVIGWHGMIHKAKRLDTLVAAFREVRAHMPGARLLLVGSQPPFAAKEADELAASLSKEPGVDLKYRRAWSEKDIRAALAEADVLAYIDGGDREQSAAASDATGLSRPIIVGTGRRYADLAPWGWQVRPESSEIARAIIRILADPTEYARLSVRAWQAASYRRPDLIGRRLVALARQAWLDRSGDSVNDSR